MVLVFPISRPLVGALVTRIPSVVATSVVDRGMISYVIVRLSLDVVINSAVL
jgi:hypothetical protein